VNFFFVKAFDTMLERKWEIFSIRRIAKSGSPRAPRGWRIPESLNPSCTIA